MHLVLISGSTRRGSYNRRLLRTAARRLPSDVAYAHWDRLRDLPLYDEDCEESATPVVVAELKRTIAAADGLMIATPEYNGSIPGGLKNALDWASRPFATNPVRDKPVLVLGASTELFGAVWAQAELRKVLKTVGAQLLVEELALGQADEAFSADGELGLPEQADRLDQAVGALVRAIHRPQQAHAA